MKDIIQTIKNIGHLFILAIPNRCFNNVVNAPRHGRTFAQNMVLLPQVYIAAWGKRYAYYITSNKEDK